MYSSKGSLATMTVQNIMLVGEVFQIEDSDGLVHPLGSRQNVNLYPARVFTSGEFLGVCCKRITPISVQNSLFCAEAFQKEVSYCLPLLKCNRGSRF